LTLEAWVYWDGLNGGILGRWGVSSNDRSYLLYALGNNFRMYVSPDGVAGANYEQNNSLISAGWNHLVGVYDGSNIVVYLNGSANGSSAYSSGIFSANESIEIGRYNNDVANAYNNDIAQPRIYNRALTAEEVQRNYNAGKNIYTN